MGNETVSQWTGSSSIMQTGTTLQLHTGKWMLYQAYGPFCPQRHPSQHVSCPAHSGASSKSFCIRRRIEMSVKIMWQHHVRKHYAPVRRGCSHESQHVYVPSCNNRDGSVQTANDNLMAAKPAPSKPPTVTTTHFKVSDLEDSI